MYHAFFKHKIMVLSAFLILLFLFSAILPPIYEENIYHQTAGKNSLNLSYLVNIAIFICFIIIGIKGLLFLSSKNCKKQFIFKWERIPYIIIFTDLVLTGFIFAHNYNISSSYNALSNNVLMSILMMSLISAIIVEWSIPNKIGIFLLIPSLFIGTLSSIIWHIVANNHHPDIRLYVFSQFLLIGSMLILSLLFTSHYLNKHFLIIALALLGLAKICELLDKFIYTFSSHVINGLVVNNVLITLSMVSILLYLKTRQATLIRL